MSRTATTAAHTNRLVSLLAGTAFAVTRMCPGDRRGTGDDARKGKGGGGFGGEGNDRVRGQDVIRGREIERPSD